jgi:hypothetical protein
MFRRYVTQPLQQREKGNNKFICFSQTQQYFIYPYRKPTNASNDHFIAMGRVPQQSTASSSS